MKIIQPVLIAVIAAAAFAGCKKNDMSGAPVITSVRAVDTSHRDSTFTSGKPGDLIAIQGHNLGGLRAVYFNDTLASFNPVYATGSDILVYIPSFAQTIATDPSANNQIRILTSHGSATYSFKLVLDPPYITSISFNDSGTQVIISGGNFQGLDKVTFPGNQNAVSFQTDTSYRTIHAVIPQGGSGVADSLRVYCTFGKAAFPYPPPMTITSLSDENASAGTTLTINGTNFVGINKVTFPVGIEGTNIVSQGVGQLTVTVPDGITTPGPVILSGTLGTVTTPYAFDSWLQPASPGYLTNFENQWNSDNTGFVGWTGTYDDAATAATNYPGATGACGALIQGSPMPKNSSAGTQGNPGFLQLNPVPWVADPSTTKVSDYSLKFEAYVKKPWSAGAVWIAIGGWYGWTQYAARYAPWESAPSGKYQTSGWVTVTIPLTQMLAGNPFWNTTYTMGAPATYFSDYPATDLCFMLMNDGGKDVPANALDIGIDNVRIVKNK